MLALRKFVGPAEMPLHRGDAWRTVVVVASGPSMDGVQAADICEAHRAGRCRVVVVNDTWRLLPRADVLFASDAAWWKVHLHSVAASFTGERWTTDGPGAREYKLQYIPCVRGEGAPIKGTEILNGGNSGYNAIGLSYLFGARKIVLVGFDMQKGGDGRQHWFGSHQAGVGLSGSLPIRAWLQRFDKLAADLETDGVDLINCTRETAIRCIRREPLRSTLWE